MTHFRPPPPKPTRLNQLALVGVGALGLLTIAAVWATSCGHTRAQGADRSADVSADAPGAPRRTVAPQHPSYPITYRTDSLAPRIAPAASQSDAARPVAPVSPPHAWGSALMVRVTSPTPISRADSVTAVAAPVAASPYVLLSGTVMSASLVTEIHSTLPGLVSAQVERDVYDTPTMRWVLIPRGSRLVGRYDSKVAPGEDVLSVVWTRVIFPDGRTLSLPDFESAEGNGTSGLRGAVNSHLGRAYLDAGLLSVVGAGAQLSQAPASVPYGVATPGQVIAGSVGQQMTERSLEVLRNDAQMTPVITVRGGTSFLVVVSRDVVFDRPY